MERLALENPRSLEFLEFIDTSRILMDVSQLGTTTSGIRPVDTTSSDPRQYGDGRGEVIPSFDGADFIRYERRGSSFCVQYTSDPTQREGLVNFWSDWKDVHSIHVKKSRTWETSTGVENLLDHLRTHFEPTVVVRRGRIVDDFVYDFERQPGEEVEEYAPRRDAMPTAVPQARAL